MAKKNRVELIAEFCQNHNGSFETLTKMVHAAAESGADVGKMQTIFADWVAFRPQFEEGLVQDGVTLSIKRPYLPEYERMKRLEISLEEQRKFVDLCKKAGLRPMTTCFARGGAKRIREAGFEEVKVASYDCASFPLLRELRALFKRVVISTGATHDDEIEHAAEIMKGHDFAFLHCVTMYPTPMEEMHFSRMEWLRSLAPSVGFSEHTLVSRDGLLASQIAIALGAEVVERHFTILPADQTKDGPVSINPEQLGSLRAFTEKSKDEQLSIVKAAWPDWKKSMGEARRALSPAELLNRDYFRGRFATPRPFSKAGRSMIFNWEETPLP